MNAANFAVFTKDGTYSLLHAHILAAFRIEALQLKNSLIQCLSQGLTYPNSFGSRTIDVSGELPFQMDSVQWIASLSKLVTLVAWMIVVDQKLIRLDDCVKNIVPESKILELLLDFEEPEKRPRKSILEEVTTPINLR